MPRTTSAAALVPLGLSCLLWPGCASTNTKEKAQLEKRLAELVRREAENNRRIEDLNTRLFLLEDKLDRGAERTVERSSADEADEGMQHLPVVRLKPRHIPSRSGKQPSKQPSKREESGAAQEEAEAPVSRVEEARPGAEGTQSLVAAHRVEYDGAALKGGSRPVLRLRGRRTRQAFAGDLGEIEGASLDERLSVVPLASKRVAEALARAAPRARKDRVVAEYKKALVMYRERRLADAVGAFRKLIDDHPKHDYVDNAMYWLAECFYDLRQYPGALDWFKRVVARYPAGNKAPDALLKVGYSYLRMRQPKKGRAVLRQVGEKYPGTRVAKLASATLSKLEKPD